MTILKAIEPAAISENSLVFNAQPEWRQGRTLFGGLQQAMALRAMRERLGEGLPLRSFQTLFIGPVSSDQVVVNVRILRRGKSVTHCEARVMDGEDTACLCTAAFGASRDSAVNETPVMPDAPKSAQNSIDMPFIKGRTPDFLQFFEAKLAKGGFPGSGQRAAESCFYVRFREAIPAGEIQLIMLADYPPTPALSQFETPAFASSLTASVTLFPLQRPLTAKDYVRLDIAVRHGIEGYVSHDTLMWTPSGELAATAQQVVTVFG